MAHLQLVSNPVAQYLVPRIELVIDNAFEVLPFIKKGTLGSVFILALTNSEYLLGQSISETDIENSISAHLKTVDPFIRDRVTGYILIDGIKGEAEKIFYDPMMI